MQGTFRRIAKALGLVFCNIDRDLVLSKPDIYFSPHSRFSDRLLSQTFRGLHLIRDPRDVVISGMHYHKKAREKWLHEPQEKFGGASYQEALIRTPDADQLIFEMEHVGVETIAQMLEWNYDDPRFFEARYEALIDDRDGRQFRPILGFLGFDAEAIPVASEQFRRTALFSRKDIPADHQHIRSGKTRQWQIEFTRRDGERFVEILGDSLLTLGYERNHGWLNCLRELDSEPPPRRLEESG